MPTAVQIAPPNDNPPLGQLKLGALSVIPGVRLVEIGVDTNVFDLSGTERRPADFTTTIQPQAMFRFALPSFDAQVTPSVGLVYYHRYASERAINPGVTLVAEKRFSSFLSLYGSGGATYSKERVGYEIESRPRQLLKSGLAGGRVRLSKLLFDLRGSRGSRAYAQSAQFQGVQLATTLDRTTTAAGLTASYPLSPYTTVTVATAYSTERFKNDADRDANSTRQAVGLSFDPRAIIRGDAELGYRTANYLSNRAPNYAGLTPAASIAFDFRDVTSVAFGFRRDVEASFSLTQPYFVYQRYEASIRQGLFHRFDLGLTAAHVVLDYRSFFDLPEDVDRDHQVVRNLSVSFGVVVRRNVRVGIYAARWQRLDDVRPYVSDRIGLQMTLGRASVGERGVFLNGPAR